jgi:hypothetical protein
MARKTVDRKAKRAEAEAADKQGTTSKKAPAAKKPETTKKAAPKRKSRAKGAEVRLKAFWGVFNQSLKRVALFEHSERKQADQKAKDLTASGKSPHFVQPVKEVVQE